MSSTTRREALVAIVATASAPSALAQQHQHPAETPAAAYKARTLTPSEMNAAGKLADVIIPRTDTPGASDAGVPEFIDRRLTATPPLASAFRAGMSLLDTEAKSKFGAPFAEIENQKQIELLTAASQAPDSELGRFVTLAKNLTIDGYYSSRAGLVDELGWHGNTFLTEFKGCTHPEHQS